MRVTALILALSLGAALPACKAFPLIAGNPDEAAPEDRDWQETEPLPAPSYDALWERCRVTLQAMDYSIDDSRSKFAEKRLVTRWQLRLAPTRLAGSRRCVYVDFVPAGDRWVVRAAVVRQKNADIRDPSNPVLAKWEDDGTDMGRTGLILYQLRAAVLDERGADE